MTQMQNLERLGALGSLDKLEAALGQMNMLAGWAPRPKSSHPYSKSIYEPAHWRYAHAKAALQSAGRLIATEDAERRNFILRNPAPGNVSASTLRTLICAYQSMLPGETARSHRHTAHALRVILESRGSYSVVDGQKHPMESGDVVLTPGWCWHGHGHEGSEQAYWFDGLDVPLNRLLEPMFFQDHPEGFAKIESVVDASPMRFRWRDIVAQLAGASRNEYHGAMVSLPADSMPTLSLTVHGWRKGESSRPFRHTANSVFVVMKGAGRSTIGDQTFDWEFGDTIAAPGWHRIEHHVTEDSVLFSMSDEALMRWSRFYRFEEL